MSLDIFKLIAVLAFVIAVLIYMPLFFTYLSEGNLRPPSQIIPELHNKK